MELPTASRVHRFKPDGLDPITVYVEEYGPNRARIVVQCYAQAWTAYWGAHGCKSVEAFVAGCNANYITDNLTWGNNCLYLKRSEKLQLQYVERIAAALIAHFAHYREAD